MVYTCLFVFIVVSCDNFQISLGIAVIFWELNVHVTKKLVQRVVTISQQHRTLHENLDGRGWQWLSYYLIITWTSLWQKLSLWTPVLIFQGCMKFFSLSFSAHCVYCYLVMRPSSIFHCLLSNARLSKWGETYENTASKSTKLICKDCTILCLKCMFK